ncbi:MAG: DUF3037 domain-containing protein [Symploca sp. SIO1C2]|nr:DUF3037 domain-containing protein [Symploca sp. SIO1C2]
MASRYSIIQYVPNPIADERINIGVLVFDRHNVKVHFLSNWNRVSCFGSQADIKTLKDFAHRMQESAEKGLLFPGDEPSDRPKHERLLEVSLGWINSIQFTQPRGSLEPIDSLLDDVIQTYLLEPQPKLKSSDDFPEPEQELGRVTVWLKQAKPEDIAQIVQLGADLLTQIITEEKNKSHSQDNETFHRQYIPTKLTPH